MIAKFTGTKSLGYIKGEVYELKTFVANGFLWVKDVNKKSKSCPYKNMESLLNNWIILSENEINKRID